ncbi:DivIVA domain-containing protein [Hymenobacter busanensis]|uniref:DivIVA domain-containing protein n=1 Tax=Hymenobacter busanensis TaxID=2607656 RepID=A0A7L5A3R9_9BACT|nr:DivIVA domain-containing protein [Hymenobacter busanensis]KAA9338352.1 DivIVA domain-containing protein [Hymenobacter busanensis]QHJ09222.1 DivIVA domain-containing protein [Hymenobacter busanensis]
MKITPLDIRQKTFERAFRGVDKDEVDAFLLTLSQQWERMSDENRELRRQLDQAQHDVQKMREVETSLYRTLKTAEDTSTSIVDQAQKSAELKQREAQLQAEQLLADARQKARRVVDEAYQQAEKAVADMQAEVNTLGQEHQRLESVLDTLMRDLQHLAAGVQEKVEKAQQRPRGSVAAILSRAASVKVNREEPASPATDTSMYVQTSSASSAASVPATAPATGGAAYGSEPTNRPIGPQPGKQPQPGEPAHTPGPEINPAHPHENPGISEPSRIYVPEPSQVPSPGAPNVEPARPDIQPVTPNAPEIAPPTPQTHPGMATVPAGAEAEKSFFDEI